jgi:hypothetical protein
MAEYNGACLSCGLLWAGSSAEEECPRCGTRYTKMVLVSGEDEPEGVGPLATAYRTALVLIMVVLAGVVLFAMVQ